MPQRPKHGKRLIWSGATVDLIMELFEIEGRLVAVTARGAGGFAWVLRAGAWVWASRLANKEGVPLSLSAAASSFPEAVSAMSALA